MYRRKARQRSKHVQAKLERGAETLSRILDYNADVFDTHSRVVIEAFSETKLELWQALQQSHSAKWQLGQLAACIVGPIRACARRVLGGPVGDSAEGVVRAE